MSTKFVNSPPGAARPGELPPPPPVRGRRRDDGECMIIIIIRSLLDGEKGYDEAAEGYHGGVVFFRRKIPSRARCCERERVESTLIKVSGVSGY